MLLFIFCGQNVNLSPKVTHAKLSRLVVKEAPDNLDNPATNFI